MNGNNAAKLFWFTHLQIQWLHDSILLFIPLSSVALLKSQELNITKFY